MKLLARRTEADAASLDLVLRAERWRHRTRTMRAFVAQHRAGVIVGGGVAAGFATTVFPLASLMRIASAFAGTVSLMLEGPILRLLAREMRRASAGEGPEPPQ
ncbi:MAG TPA: hypothetical protein VJ696_12725 [Rhodanobacteraceae bacterium]|nr:hypothetical protein [Rhodanobacteraceae bacterium]